MALTSAVLCGGIYAAHVFPATSVLPDDRTVGALLAASRVFMDAGLVVLVGALVLAIATPNVSGIITAAGQRMLGVARFASAVTAAATLVFAVSTTADVLAVSAVDVLRQPSLVLSFVTQTTLGTALLWQLGALVVFAPLTLVTQRTIAALTLSLLPAVVVIARAATGHSGNSEWHMAAVESWAFHIAAMCVWVGSVLVMALPHTEFNASIATRITSLIRVCVVLVVLSGVVNAAVRVSHVEQLFTTRYGQLIVVKVLALIAAVWIASRWSSSKVTTKHPDDRVVKSVWLRNQALLFCAVIIVSVALSRTAPPVNPDAQIGFFTNLRQILGFTPPPEPSFANLTWTQWRPDVFWLAVAGLAGTLYLRAARLLRARGDVWSRKRTASWIAGLAVLTYATSGPLGVYGHIFFSAHMAQHLLLVMVSPLLLVVAAPMTLALRTLPANKGHTGAREWLLALLHSRYLRIIGHPLIAFINFVGGFFALYFSGLFELLMGSHTGHLLMQLHFLLSGYLFFAAVIGNDPAPRSLPAPARAGLALLAAPFHAVFSVIVMQSNTVIASDYFAPFAAAYRTDALHDQYVGSSLGWAFGEVPMVIVIVIAVTQWVRADAREAARFDRWDDERRAREAAETAESSATE